MTITLQPASFADATAPDGSPLYRQPYPFHVDEDGAVLRQDFWRGDPARILGFTTHPDRHEVVVPWKEVVADPQQAVGLYAVAQDAHGDISSLTLVIETVQVSE